MICLVSSVRVITLNRALFGLIYQTMNQGEVSHGAMKLFHEMIKA